MGVNTAGQEITDPEEWCMAFGEDQGDYDNLMGMVNQCSEEEKDSIYEILGCPQKDCFNGRGDLAQHLSRLTEDDYVRIKE